MKQSRKNLPDDVLICGIEGIILGSAPFFLFALPNFNSLGLLTVTLINLLWLFVIGNYITKNWSSALHALVRKLKDELEVRGFTPVDPKKGPPERIQLMPVWIGIFERLFYFIFIGLDVSSAGTFIAAWIGLKLASGWGTWSAGETYGRAVFFAGVLGNAMSLLFGISTGLVLRAKLSMLSF